MNEKVKRFDLATVNYRAYMGEAPDGVWVEYDDYARLEAENAELRARLSANRFADRREPAYRVTCDSCGAEWLVSDPDDATCRGCGGLICCECVIAFGHLEGGQHGRGDPAVSYQSQRGHIRNLREALTVERAKVKGLRWDLKEAQAKLRSARISCQKAMDGDLATAGREISKALAILDSAIPSAREADDAEDK